MSEHPKALKTYTLKNLLIGMEKVLRAVWSFSFWSKSELSQIETLFSMAFQTTGSILGGV